MLPKLRFFGLHFLLQTAWVYLQSFGCSWLSDRATEFDEIGKNNGHNAAEGHSGSQILVSIESLYVADYLSNFLSRKGCLFVSLVGGGVELAAKFGLKKVETPLGSVVYGAKHILHPEPFRCK